MKRCNHCLAYKYRSEFYRNKSAEDGLQARCKACTSRFGKATYAKHKGKLQAKRSTPAFKASYAAYYQEYMQRNHEVLRQKGRAYRAAHPALSPARQAYLAAHHEERLRYLARYRVQDRPRQRARERAWREQHRERYRLRMLRRRARQVEAPGWFTDAQVAMRVAYYGHRCAYCHGPYETIDHVIPLARGGSNWPSNLRPCCRRCNARKGTRLLHEWQRSDFPNVSTRPSSTG